MHDALREVLRYLDDYDAMNLLKTCKSIYALMEYVEWEFCYDYEAVKNFRYLKNMKNVTAYISYDSITKHIQNPNTQIVVGNFISEGSSCVINIKTKMLIHESVTRLHFNVDVNDLVDIPSTVKHIILSHSDIGCDIITNDLELESLWISQKYFNTSSIPEGIKELVLNCKAMIFPDKLPDSIEYLDIARVEFSFAGMLPKYLKHFSIRRKFNNNIEDCFNEGLEYLDLGLHFNHPVEGYLPRSLKTLILVGNFNQPISDLANLMNLEYLTLGSKFNHAVVMPRSLRCVRFGDAFNHPLLLHEGLEVLELGMNYEHELDIPQSLTCLRIRGKFYRGAELDAFRRKL